MGTHRPRERHQVGTRTLIDPDLQDPLDRPRQRTVRVLPDVPAIDKTFDYLVPDDLVDEVTVGTMVRVLLSGRRVGAWVLAVDVDPPEGVKLAPIAKVTGWGPTGDLLELSKWASWRWAGGRAAFLKSASPDKAVRSLPRRGPALPSDQQSLVATHTALDADVGCLITEAFRVFPSDGIGEGDGDGDGAGGGASVLRLPPTTDRFAVALEAASRGNALILVPSSNDVGRLAIRLRRAGVEVATLPSGWAAARAGSTVLGTRVAAWAPVVDLAAVVVFDEHDEAYRQEQSPTWHARDVVVERGRRAGVPVVLVSPTPSLEALGTGRLVAPSRTVERVGWPIVDVVDRRDEDPARAGLYSPQLGRLLQSDARVVCVVNRKGRSRLLACDGCGVLARCEACESAVAMTDSGELSCPVCAMTRPVVCGRCGRTKMKNLRAGVSRVREELEALARDTVVEVTGDTEAFDPAKARVHVGTEAVLHRIHAADAVVFLDFDQELLAPRYRAAEEAMSLIVRAARIVGGRRKGGGGQGGRLMIQTRIPHHEVVQGALLADPQRVSDAERSRREMLRFPPVACIALVSGAVAPAFMDAFGEPEGVEVLGPSDDRWMLRSDDRSTLMDALAATPRPSGRLRVEVDPLRF